MHLSCYYGKNPQTSPYFQQKKHKPYINVGFGYYELKFNLIIVQTSKINHIVDIEEHIDGLP